MGKYLIRIESKDHDEVLCKEFQEGIECDGFVIMADNGDVSHVAIYQVNINTISDMIAGSNEVMTAGVLAKAKREAKDLCRLTDVNDILAKLRGQE